MRDTTDEEWFPATVDRVDASQGVRVQVEGWTRCAPGRGFVFKMIKARDHDYSTVVIADDPDAPPPPYAAAAAEAAADGEDADEGVPGSWGSDSEGEDEEGGRGSGNGKKEKAWQPDPEVSAYLLTHVPGSALARARRTRLATHIRPPARWHTTDGGGGGSGRGLGRGQAARRAIR